MSKRHKHQHENKPEGGGEGPAPESSEQAVPTPEERRKRRVWTIVAIVMVLAAAGSVGVLVSLLLGAGSSGPGKDVMACVLTNTDRDFTNKHPKNAKCPPKGAPHVDGLVQEATDTGFNLITVDGTRKSYKVRAPDRPYIDVQHAQSHASLGQPVRIYTKDVDGSDVIIYMVDSPLSF